MIVIATSVIFDCGLTLARRKLPTVSFPQCGHGYVTMESLPPPTNCRCRERSDCITGGSCCERTEKAMGNLAGESSDGS